MTRLTTALAAGLLLGSAVSAPSARAQGYGSITRNGQVISPGSSAAPPAPAPSSRRPTTTRFRIPRTRVPRIFGVNGQRSILPPRRNLVSPGISRRRGGAPTPAEISAPAAGAGETSALGGPAAGPGRPPSPVPSR